MTDTVYNSVIMAHYALLSAADERTTNVVLSCGLGFRARPGHDISRKGELGVWWVTGIILFVVLS